MPTSTYTPLATITLSSTDSEIVFASIPNSYRDLIVVLDGKATGNGVLRYRYNSDAGSNYSYVGMGGDGASPFPTSATTTSIRVLSFRTDASNAIHQVLDYADTNKQKTSLTRGNSPSSELLAVAGRWASTSPITSISLALESNSFAIGTTASLYGVIA